MMVCLYTTSSSLFVRRTLSYALAAILLLGGANAGEGTVLARVGELEIKSDELRAFIESLDPAARTTIANDPTLLNQVVRSLLAQRLILQEALSKHWDQRSDVVGRIEKARQNAIVESYLGSVSKPPESFPSEAELKTAYEAAKPALLVPRKFRLAQIFVASPKSADKSTADKAQAKLEAIRKSLALPDADFASIARLTSDEKISASRGGEIGWLTEMQVQPEIRPKVLSLAKNTVSEPILLDDGWHILQALDIAGAFTPAFEVVRNQLAEQLRMERAKADQQAYLNRLLMENPVAINELALADAVPARDRDATPAPGSTKALKPSFK